MRRDDERSERAFQAGKEFAKNYPFSEFAKDKTSDRLMCNCPVYLQKFSDVFKLGCQSAWRRKGELPNMVAKDLEPGDVFKVDKPDPESDVRVCLTNDRKNGLRFGFPNNKTFWCSMGSCCKVELVDQKK